MRRCVIFGAAATSLRPSVSPQDYVVAADGGKAQLGDIVPNLVIGDFDSLGYVPEGEHVVKLPVRKADTDMLSALRAGLKAGCSRFVIYGGLGGRMDHSIANIQCLHWLATQGARGMLVGDEQSMLVAKDGDVLRFDAASSGILSLFALDGTAKVVLRDLDYPYDGELSSTYPMGVSNAFVGKEASVVLKEGFLLCVYPTKSAKILSL
ncbi:MAG: thiamine diphosphokinase [Sphaerochaetaceae bacterium]|nr:thiamine diphosphokinase [Spirochaetales bacterium]MDY5499216.1 thiamine diphosphokinase [Sphaerochaetaceae bacterium]